MRRIAKMYLTQQRGKKARLREARHQERAQLAVSRSIASSLQDLRPVLTGTHVTFNPFDIGSASTVAELFGIQDVSGETVAQFVARLMKSDPDQVLTGVVQESMAEPVAGAHTLEDPLEFVIDGYPQVVRSAPDVILMGEIRDGEPMPISGKVASENPPASMMPVFHLGSTNPSWGLAALYKHMEASHQCITFEWPVEFVYETLEDGQALPWIDPKSK